MLHHDDLNPRDTLLIHRITPDLLTPLGVLVARAHKPRSTSGGRWERLEDSAHSYRRRHSSSFQSAVTIAYPFEIDSHSSQALKSQKGNIATMDSLGSSLIGRSPQITHHGGGTHAHLSRSLQQMHKLVRRAPLASNGSISSLPYPLSFAAAAVSNQTAAQPTTQASSKPVYTESENWAMVFVLVILGALVVSDFQQYLWPKYGACTRGDVEYIGKTLRSFQLYVLCISPLLYT